MRYRVCLLALLLCWLPCGASADEVLTWELCVSEARARQPELAAAEASLQQARAERSLAAAAEKPDISARLSTSSSGSTEPSGNPVSSYSYGVSASQLLYDGGTTAKNIAAREEAVQTNEDAYDVTSSDERLALRTAFIDMLKAQELTGLAGEIVLRRQQSTRLLQLRYDAGREHLGSLRRAEADREEARFELRQAERALVLAQAKLASAIGRDERSPIRVSGSFDNLDIPREHPDFQLLAEQHPRVRQYNAAIRQARYSFDASKRAYFPVVSASASVGKSSVESWPPDEADWNAGLALSFPLYSGGKKEAEISRAFWALNEQTERARGGYLDILDTLEESWKNFQDAAGYVHVQKTFLEAASERSRIADAQYSNGLISFDDWIIIENNLVSSKKSYLDARAHLLLAEAEWLNAQGVTLHD